MTTTTITAAGIIHRYAGDVAYVAQTDAAVDLDGFIKQLGAAARQYGAAGIIGRGDVETAVLLLAEADRADDLLARDLLLKRADVLLWQIADMTREYRNMVGG